jgi:hypothetical protein
MPLKALLVLAPLFHVLSVKRLLDLAIQLEHLAQCGVHRRVFASGEAPCPPSDTS